MTFLSRFRRQDALVLTGLVTMLFAALEATPAAAQGYLELKLVSGTPGLAIRTDPNLVVGWGIAASSGSPWWVSNNGSGTSTLYDGFGKAIPLVVTIPPAPSSTGAGSPTGIVFNGTSDFMVSQGGVSGPARFIFATLDGTISGWSPGVNVTNAVLALDNSAHGAGYTGLAIGSNSSGNFLFAANFGQGTVDVIDKTFTVVRTFTDTTLPPGFAPFGIQNINGKLYVTFANFVISFPQGFVDVFDTSGNLLQQLVANGPANGTNGQLNLPWGLALAPANFGVFSNTLLVGNLADGHINAFDPNSGAFLGPLTDRKGNTITLPFLWGIGFGNDHAAGKANVLYFATGMGVFGAIYPRGVRLQ